MGFLVSQHGQLGAIPPPPFLSVSPLESMRSGGAIPPPEKGYLSDTCAIPYENKANGCDTPLCDTISKGYCAIWGGISHWAAKFVAGAIGNCWLVAAMACLAEFPAALEKLFDQRQLTTQGRYTIHLHSTACEQQAVVRDILKDRSGVAPANQTKERAKTKSS